MLENLDQDHIEKAHSIKELIQSYGLKATHQRIAVYKAMTDLGHASADMIIEEVLKFFPTLTVATVYNILDSFAAVGLLRRIPSSEVKMFFDINTVSHIHIFREDLQTFEDYRDSDLEYMISDHLRRNCPNIKVTGFDMILKGKIIN